MLTVLYLVLAALFAYLTWQSSRLYGQQRSSYTLLLLLVLAGLVYDALVIALGRFIGQGSLLSALNLGRFAVHALLTPLLMIFAFGVLRRAGVGWAQGKAAHTAVCIVATLMVLLGVYADLARVDMQPRLVMDTLRYVNEGGMQGPPIASLVTMVFLLVGGVALWRRAGWPWLLLGSLVMFVAAGAAMGNLFFLGSVGEAVLGFANVATARRFLGGQAAQAAAVAAAARPR
ncbi:MAG: hypothetical protein RMN53_17625 [Anaerolineae bacterium]|nr:hypothetical protein [Anaerolineae bacterium]